MRALYQQLSAVFGKHKTILKAIFVLSVLIFVIIEIGRIIRDIDQKTLSASLHSQTVGSIILLTVLGLISVLPMLNYDFEIQSFLPERAPTKYILKAGWTVNTFNNLIGFGGVLGATLRANFYGKNATKKQILFAISKIALFLLSGLSLWSAVSLILIFTFGIGSMFGNYWIWLVGGALYTPILLLVTHLRESEFFSDLTIRKEVSLAIGSCFEWGFAGGFFLIIGHFLGITQLSHILPLFMIANIVGVVSMVPGALGSFDVFMILGLNAVGIDSGTAVVWLLFYRIFYYIIPFIIGLIFFVHDMGHKINVYFQDIPRQALTKAAHVFVVFILYFTAIVMLMAATIPNWLRTTHLFYGVYPYLFALIDRTYNIILAFLLIGFARGVADRVKKAYWPTLILLGIAILNSLLRDFSVPLLIIFGLALLAMLFSKKELYRDRLELAWGARLFDGGVYALTFLMYAIVGILNSPHIHHRKPVPVALLFPSERLWFTGLILVLLAALILLMIQHYLKQGEKSLDMGFDADRIRAVIDRFGGNEVSHLAFLRDKAVFYYQAEDTDQVFFLFRKKTDKLIVMGEPVGNPKYLNAAIQAFINQADQQDLHVVFYEVSDAFTMRMHEFGFDFIKFGEEGFVSLPDFNISGNKHKGQRALMNKFKREGYTFEVLAPPFSDQDFLQLKQISDSWLDGKTEKGFSLGFFDRFYLEQTPIAVIRDKTGKLIAFANSMPTGDHEVTSIDLMRHRQDAPSGIMDQVFINLLYQAQDQGYRYFNMGMAPLANVGIYKNSFLDERVAHLIYQYGYRFYSFEGLRSYKNKYVTKWVPRYIVYPRQQSLVFTMLQLMLVVNHRIDPEMYHAHIMRPDFFTDLSDKNNL
ncbi:bifunctional lysylphosphatidylglycerol flippase/synthetase MprF [Agrilactobacillus yilanensis]|uniref:Bifunctional lysylphosphatidylglycerol flippase/synthetase MprF n=1 Tax=Agrilactobacillus yilanensis TaxID=2485997 RepID=A0ABW4J8F6_9LACO|nr:bifunctional lysylphosphatidylglycerol flippase/synthetase MprF [Agrilactobacillus yilanensis]